MNHPRLKIVVIGGVAAGASCAARARRLSEDASITLIERGPDVSFANCGLPYHIGGEIESRNALKLHTPQSLSAMLGVNVRTGTEAVEIDHTTKRVAVRRLGEETLEWLDYDKLLLAPGASPLRPPLPGIDNPRIRTLRNLGDMDAIKAAAASARRVAVIGAGFIGLEMAEQFRHMGLEVTLVELQMQLLPQMDAEMTAQLARELTKNGVRLCLGKGIEGFAEKDGAVECRLAGGESVTADLVVLSIGVKPDSALAAKAGLTLGKRGHILVNGFLQTSDPDIYAAGDAVESVDRVTGKPSAVPLGGPANRQGRAAASHMLSPETARPYPGSIGTAIVRAFKVACGMTGWSAKRLQAEGIAFQSVTVKDNHHAGYYPGAKPLTLRVLWEEKTGKILGAQASGEEGVDKRIDVLATAIAAGMTVGDLANLELSYAPPFGSAKDVVNLAGMAAENLADGLLEQVPELPTGDATQIVDVRPPAAFAANPTPHAVNIPLATLRGRLGELDKSRPIVTVCAMGKTSYFAARILKQNGFSAKSLSAQA
jgi:NADPH-dependent 2,4-dienoyl-CoA reductase/sulfur reductase-like enzyme/rhodanese-related sulfurtransferase